MSRHSDDMSEPMPMPESGPAVSPSFKNMVENTVDMNSNSMLDAAGALAFDVVTTCLRGFALYQHSIANQNMDKIQKNMADKSSVPNFMIEYGRFRSAKEFCGAAAVVGGVNNVWGMIRNTKTGNDMKKMTLDNHK